MNAQGWRELVNDAMPALCVKWNDKRIYLRFMGAKDAIWGRGSTFEEACEDYLDKLRVQSVEVIGKGVITVI